MPSNIWIITLNKDSERCRTSRDSLSSQGIPYEIFQGIRGSSLSSFQKEENTTPECREFLCTPAIIGCALSHITLWKRLLEDENNHFYVVLEDDAKLVETEDFLELYTRVANKKVEFDFISMNCTGVCLKGRGEDLVEKPLGLGNVSYFISKEGARKLLEFTGGKVSYHIDFVVQLANYQHPSFKKLATDKDIFQTIGETSSSISSDNRTLLYALSNNDLLKWFCNVPMFVLDKRVVSQEFFWTFLLMLLTVGLLLKYKKDSLVFASFFVIINFLFCLSYYIESKPV